VPFTLTETKENHHAQGFFGGKNEAAQDFELSDDLIAVRTRSRQSAT
jgi:hypothetical protein